jgi:4-amino-4-deoxy-L-arabinose transferase-like glycosyltransferase
MSSKYFITTVTVVVLVGVLTILWTTSPLIGYMEDTRSYDEMAGNFLHERWKEPDYEPITHFPPFYPLAVSVVAKFTGTEPISAARTLNVILIAFTSVLLAVFGKALHPGNSILPILAALVFVVSQHVIYFHSVYLSEPLFIALSLLAYYLIYRYVLTGSVIWFVGAGLIIGSATLTRYVGITLVPPVLLLFLIVKNGSWVMRCLRGGVFAGVSALPVVAVLVYNSIVTGSGTNRTLTFHLVETHKLKSLVMVLHDYFLPIPYPSIIRLVVMLFVVGCAVRLIMRSFKQAPPISITNNASISLMILSAGFIGTYIPFLLFSISFVDAATPLDARILLPYFPMAIVLILSTIAFAGFSKWTVRGKSILYAGLASSILINSIASVPRAIEFHQEGMGLTSKMWQSSPTIAALEGIPKSVEIYTNAPGVVSYLAGREAHLLPRIYNELTRMPNDSFDDELQSMADLCREGQAIVVFFNYYEWMIHLPTKASLEALNGLEETKEYQDGILMGRMVKP